MKRLIQREIGKLRSVFVHPTFLFLTLAGNTLLLLATFAVYHLEKAVNPRMSTYFDCLWWGVSTITTVGFGDVVPITPWGRLIGMMLMYSGTVLFVCFISVLGSIWTRLELERDIVPLEKEIHDEEKETHRLEGLLKEINQRLERLEKKER